MTLLLQVNLLLAVTALLMLGEERLFAWARGRVPGNRKLRFAQVTFVAAIVLPLGLKLIPSSDIRGVSSPTFRVYAEGLARPLPLSASPRLRTPDAPALTPAPAPVEPLDYQTLLLGLWLAGLIFFAARFGRDYYRMCAVLRGAVELKTYRRIRIVASGDVHVPFSVRTFRSAWIVLPGSLLSERADRDLAVKHELQHHRQGDTWWVLLMEFVGCAFYANPAMHLWKNIITELQEYACDEALTGQKEIPSQTYGSCLLRVAEAALEHRQMYVGTTSMAAIIKDSKYFRKFLLRRIEMITEERAPRRTWMALVAAAGTLGMTLAFAVGAEKLVRAESGVNPGTLATDPAIQKMTDEILSRALARHRATAGFIIVAEPATGKILAVSNADRRSRRAGHWILNQRMETASIQKPLVVAQGLEEEKISLGQEFDCEKGSYSYNGQVYRDWKDVGWPKLTTVKAIANSSNICAIKIGQAVGETGIRSLLDRFGFGENGVASHLPEARVGERPAPGPQFIPQATIGLGFKSTPVEVLQAYGAIANGGQLMEPVPVDGSPHRIRKVLGDEAVSEMRRLLRAVVLEGTGDQAASDLYSTAGKTASSFMNDFMDEQWPKQLSNYAGFIGFAPVGKPAVEVYVGIINPNSYRIDGKGIPHDGAHGRTHAAPVFKEVVENVLTHLKVSPDRI